MPQAGSLHQVFKAIFKKFLCMASGLWLEYDRYVGGNTEIQ